MERRERWRRPFSVPMSGAVRMSEDGPHVMPKAVPRRAPGCSCLGPTLGLSHFKAFSYENKELKPIVFECLRSPH